MVGNKNMAIVIKKLKAKYASLSQAKRATLWITLSGFILRGISFITVPIFTRLLTTDEYGSFSVYQSWESVFVYVVTLGVAYGGFNNGMVRYPDDREGYTTSVMGLICAMGLFWTILTFLFPGLASTLLGMPGSYIILMLVEVIASEVYDVWVCRARYDFEYRKVVGAAAFLAVGVPALGIPFVYFAQDKVLARIIAVVIIYIGIAVAVGSSTLHRSKKIFCWKYWKFTILFNVPLLPHYLSQVVLSSSDRIMIGQLCSKSDAGIYSIAYSAGMISTILTSSLSSTVMPWLYRKLEGKEYEPVGKVGFELLVFLGVMILLMDILAPDIVNILAPAKYGEAMHLIPVIAASVFFIFLYSYCSNIEFFYEQTRVATIASVLAAVLNIALNSVFIRIFGYEAAGYTTLICYMVLGIAHYAFAQHVAKEKAGQALLDGKAIWGIAIALICASVLFANLNQYPVVRYSVLAIAIAICIWKRKAIQEKVKEIRS